MSSSVAHSLRTVNIVRVSCLVPTFGSDVVWSDGSSKLFRQYFPVTRYETFFGRGGAGGGRGERGGLRCQLSAATVESRFRIPKAKRYVDSGFPYMWRIAWSWANHDEGTSRRILFDQPRSVYSVQ